MPATKETARLEQSLRGWKDRSPGPANMSFDDRMEAGEAPFRDSEGSRRWPTNPDTPEGREWWCEALKLGVWEHVAGGWVVRGGRPFTEAISNSRTEAITAAIHAAAAQHAKKLCNERVR